MHEYDIGDSVRLIEPYKGWSVGEVIGYDGNKVVIMLTNGKELSVYVDELEDN